LVISKEFYEYSKKKQKDEENLDSDFFAGGFGDDRVYYCSASYFVIKKWKREEQKILPHGFLG